jgi:hypothetical protein
MLGAKGPGRRLLLIGTIDVVGVARQHDPHITTARLAMSAQLPLGFQVATEVRLHGSVNVSGWRQGDEHSVMQLVANGARRQFGRQRGQLRRAQEFGS